MALSRATKKNIEKHRAWQKYANKELDKGRQPTKYKDYETSSSYFRGIKSQTTESRMKAAGIDWDKDKPSAKLTRKKK